MKYLGIAICVAGLHAASALRAAATPVAFGANFYDFIQVPDPFTGNNNAWATASAAAAASVFNGVSGHLATITSQAENDFLFGLVSGSFSGFKGAWLGGKAPEGWLVGPETGQGFSYTNWGGIEPNNNGFAYMNIGTLFAGIGPGKWADDSGVQGVPDPNNDPVIGYFVEYEGAAAVPDPSSWLLLASGLAGLAVQRRKRVSRQGQGTQGTRTRERFSVSQVLQSNPFQVLPVEAHPHGRADDRRASFACRWLPRVPMKDTIVCTHRERHPVVYARPSTVKAAHDHCESSRNTGTLPKVSPTVPAPGALGLPASRASAFGHGRTSVPDPTP
jgi:hypothetical protein